MTITISIYRTDLSPSTPTHAFIQSQSRDKCIRYNPIQSYDYYAPGLSFKPLLWILLIGLVAFSVAAIVMGEALDYPLVRREGKMVVLNNDTAAEVDVLEEKNGTDDLLYLDGDDDHIIAESGSSITETGLSDSLQVRLDNTNMVKTKSTSHPTEINLGMNSTDEADSSSSDYTHSSNNTQMPKNKPAMR